MSKIQPLKDPQQVFQIFVDPQGNKLAAINRDGTMYVQGIKFADGTVVMSGGQVSGTDAGTF